ncbi:MBL fold metallo-hydrolase [soil metagenome]
MHYQSLGGTEEITASCHYLNVAGTGLLFDAGMDPEQDGMDAVPPFELLDGRPVDHVVVTHAHHDHLGSLPVLLQQRPEVQIHLSKPTMMLADVLLPASARLQRRRQMESVTAAAPIFDEATAEALSYLYEAHNLDTDFDLSGAAASGTVTGRFYNAGHVLGAVSLHLTIVRDGRTRTVYYTSDVHLRPQNIIPGADIPEGPIDVLILETTLGADPEAELATPKEREKALGDAIARVLARGGSVLIPVFALGRAQEVVALLDRFKKQRRIPADVPVFTTGSMRAVADIYDRTRLISPRLDKDFEVFGVHQSRLPRSRERETEILSKPGIHIAASGMMFEKTLSNSLSQRMISDPKNGIFLVGFAKEDSPADLLLKAAERRAEDPNASVEVTLDRERGPQPLRAEVERFRFSGHAHRRDLLDIVEKTKPKKIVLVHGERPAKEWMADNIRFFYPEIEIFAPEQGEEIEL